MHVRKGDKVLVIAGNDKGKQGVVLDVDRVAGRVVIEGVNMRWRHKKPTQQTPKGERSQREAAIHSSNVMHLDPQTGKGVRGRPDAQAASAKKKAPAKKKAAKKA